MLSTAKKKGFQMTVERSSREKLKASSVALCMPTPLGDDLTASDDTWMNRGKDHIIAR